MAKKNSKLKDSDRVSVSMTVKQLRIINHALEAHFRLLMGQAFGCGLADEMAFMNVEFRKEDREESERLFDECIERRDLGVDSLQNFIDICLGTSLERRKKTPDTEVEIDIWSAVRHWFWTQLPEKDKKYCGVDSYPPFVWGDEPPVDIRREEKNK